MATSSSKLKSKRTCMLREIKIECAREGQGGHFLITIRLIQGKLDIESKVATSSSLLVSQRKVYSEM